MPEYHAASICASCRGHVPSASAPNRLPHRQCRRHVRAHSYRCARTHLESGSLDACQRTKHAYMRAYTHAARRRPKSRPGDLRPHCMGREYGATTQATSTAHVAARRHGRRHLYTLGTDTGLSEAALVGTGVRGCRARGHEDRGLQGHSATCGT